MPLRIVLVEPREAGNVGAAARAMKNFGFADLVIVGKAPPLAPVAEWWASGAEDVVNGARQLPTLPQALAGAGLTVATTSSRGRSLEADLTPSSLAELVGPDIGSETIAIVFGREDRGLTAEETAFCQRTAVIPTNPLSPTMNLAQSVSIFCYELSRLSGAEADLSPRRADAALLERLHERAQALLMETGFLHANNPDRIYRDLRRMAGRAGLDERDVTILLAIINQIEWKIAAAAAAEK